MRLFINSIVAKSLLVAVFLSGSLMRSIATEEDGEFSSFNSTRLLGLKLKNAFSELENKAERIKKIRIKMNPNIPTKMSDPKSTVPADSSRMNIC